MENGFVDCHCHISAREFAEDLEDVIQRTREAGVKTLVAVTEEVSEFDRVLQLQERYPDLVAPCFGIHPLQGDEGPAQRSVKPQTARTWSTVALMKLFSGKQVFLRSASPLSINN
ncbi:hypothetical protein FQN60_015457 [Etheostoma spectabile]|uniref:TatD DNase domain containing 3 n=1 Tax=Etheostoma spectabile TaxID=54343 RepID=A0A5J5CU26_9PERO|nr:hypothetical protein FQN60_015457 [Etheostoma spectabile]